MPHRRPLKGTAASADLRLKLLHKAGHRIDVQEGSPTAVTIAITRKDGTRHTETVTAEDLRDIVRESPAFRKYSQTILLTRAIHAACDWSEKQDNPTCPTCSKPGEIRGGFNFTTTSHDWYCIACYFGKAP